VPKVSRVLVSEILAYPLPGHSPYIELYNANGSASVDIGGWFWSDDKYNKAKYKYEMMVNVHRIFVIV
jgi:hypothetical protein